MHARTRKSTTLPIGSLSSDTLNPRDLLPIYLDALNGIRLTKAERAIVRQIDPRWRQFDVTAVDLEPVQDDLDQLSTILEQHIPEYTYFGCHENDGAAIGVWPIEIDDPDVFRSSSLPGEMPKGDQALGCAYWLHVNDHGNMTLYRRAGHRWVEVWAIV